MFVPRVAWSYGRCLARKGRSGKQKENDNRSIGSWSLNHRRLTRRGDVESMKSGSVMNASNPYKLRHTPCVKTTQQSHFSNLNPQTRVFHIQHKAWSKSECKRSNDGRLRCKVKEIPEYSIAPYKIRLQEIGSERQWNRGRRRQEDGKDGQAQVLPASRKVPTSGKGRGMGVRPEAWKLKGEAREIVAGMADLSLEHIHRGGRK